MSMKSQGRFRRGKRNGSHLGAEKHGGSPKMGIRSSRPRLTAFSPVNRVRGRCERRTLCRLTGFGTEERMTSLDFDRARRTGHGVEAHEKLEILQGRTCRSVARTHGAVEPGQICDQMPCGLSSFAVRPGQQEHWSRPARILDESNDGKGFAGAKPAGGGRVNGAFAWTGMKVLNDLLIEVFAENETKVQLIFEEVEPGIRAGAADEHEAVPGLHIGNAQGAGRTDYEGH